MLGACLGFLIFVVGVFSLTGDIESPAFGRVVLPVFENFGLLALIALGLAAVVWLTFWLTPTPLKKERDGADVKKMLNDPYVQRTILRFEIGGIIAGVIALVFAVGGLYEANSQTRLAQEALKDQRISSAWQILAQPGNGVAGKVYSLEILANESDEELLNINIGCAVPVEFGNFMGEEFEQCKYPASIKNLELGSNTSPLLKISRSDFSHSNTSNVTFQNAELNDIGFRYGQNENLRFNNTAIAGIDFSYSQTRTEFNHSSVTRGNFKGVDGLLHFSNSMLDLVSFADLSTFTGNGTNGYPLEGVIIEDSNLYEIDFTGFNFVPNGLQFIGKSNALGDSLEYPNAPYPPLRIAANAMPYFNISGAIFCRKDRFQMIEKEGYVSISETTEGAVTCWEQASQEFFSHTWFFEDNPPVGIELLPFEAKLASGCKRRIRENDPDRDWAFNHDGFFSSTIYDSCSIYPEDVIEIQIPLSSRPLSVQGGNLTVKYQR